MRHHEVRNQHGRKNAARLNIERDAMRQYLRWIFVCPVLACHETSNDVPDASTPTVTAPMPTLSVNPFDRAMQNIFEMDGGGLRIRLADGGTTGFDTLFGDGGLGDIRNLASDAGLPRSRNHDAGRP